RTLLRTRMSALRRVFFSRCTDAEPNHRPAGFGDYATVALAPPAAEPGVARCPNAAGQDRNPEHDHCSNCKRTTVDHIEFLAPPRPGCKAGSCFSSPQPGVQS